MKISSSAYFAVESLVRLAVYDAARPCPVESLAHSVGCSVSFTEQLMAELCVAGLVKGTWRGCRGYFELLDDWEDRYRYVIELGRALPPLPEAARTEANKVRGCASQVWLATAFDAGGAGWPPRLSFEGDSDAHIVRGLIAILFAIYSGRCADEILRTEAQAVFRRLGLAEHLTPQRSNGFASMVERICSDARRAMSTEARGHEPRTAPTINAPLTLSNLVRNA